MFRDGIGNDPIYVWDRLDVKGDQARRAVVVDLTKDAKVEDGCGVWSEELRYATRTAP